MCGILCCFELLNQQNASSDSLPEPKDKGFGETFSFLKNETVNRGPDYVSPVLDYSFKIDTKEEYMQRVREGFYAVVNRSDGYGRGYMNTAYSPAAA